MVENYLNDLVIELLISQTVSSFKILKRAIGEEDGYIRVKCSLTNGDMLKFAEYIKIRRKKAHIENYSFHWQTKRGMLIKRWDNVAHHKELDTFPHHMHLSKKEVCNSTPMTLKKVLREIEQKNKE